MCDCIFALFVHVHHMESGIWNYVYECVIGRCALVSGNRRLIAFFSTPRSPPTKVVDFGPLEATLDVFFG
jgi:hypothetical protein